MAASRQFGKSAKLLSLLIRDRSEFIERLTAICDVQSQFLHRKPSYPDVSSLEEGLGLLDRILGAHLTGLLGQSSFQEFERTMRSHLHALPASAPMGQFHNADEALARIVYAIARAIRPHRIVETGVCYGVTSAYMLKALHDNRSGHLHSIDLPPLGENADSFVGCLVPTDLRDCWTLHRGSSRRLLPHILEEQKSVQMFVHDSLHTRANMRREFAAAWKFMSSGSVLVSDDIEGNSAFAELASIPGVRSSVILESQSKKALVGVVVKC